MLLLIDHYDSFTYNLVHAFECLGATVLVVPFDQINSSEIPWDKICGLVLSPGPGSPDDAVFTQDLVKTYYQKLPILGVCLGHQIMARVFGGLVLSAGQLVHGKASLIDHTGTDIFEGVPTPISVGRYHSLVVNFGSLDENWVATAWTKDGMLMGMAHRELPLFGVQFHPESILSPEGPQLLANFWGYCSWRT